MTDTAALDAAVLATLTRATKQRMLAAWGAPITGDGENWTVVIDDRRISAPDIDVVIHQALEILGDRPGVPPWCTAPDDAQGQEPPPAAR